MKKIILLILVYVHVALLAAGDPGTFTIKGSFSGVVTDAFTGKALQGVSVFIADAKAGSTTNARGEFLINNIIEGIHLVEVSHIGYTTIAEQILIQGDTKKDFLLSAAIIENNAVVVTGVSKATQLKKMPFQVAVMRKEDLLRNASANIIDAISRKPGVSAISTGPAIAKPVIRGLGYNRVLTINDGVRQEGQQWGDEHGLEIDESSVNKVEILKGPASLIYGSDAMAGVINIITNAPVQNNTMKINAGAGYQTNNRLRTVYGNWAGNNNGFNWSMYGSGKAAGDYRNKYDGYVYNSKFNERNTGGYAGYNGSWGYSHLVVSSYDLRSGLVEGERDAEGFFIKPVAGGGSERASIADFKTADPQIPFQHIRHFKVAADNNIKLGKDRLSLNVGWQRNRREEFGNIDDPAERSLFFDLKTITHHTQYHFREINQWRLSLGLNGMSQENANRGAEQLVPDYRLHDLGSFVFFQKAFSPATISGGLRFDNRTINVKPLMEGSIVKGNAFKRSFSNFSGSIGAAIQLGPYWNIKMNIARAFRAPGIAELASNGAHEGTTRYEYGTTTLESETSIQTDAAIEFENEHFSLNLAGYYNRFNNFIFYKKLLSVSGGDSTVNVNGDDLAAFQFDQHAASLAGMELTLDVHPHPLDWLHLQNTFSLVSGRFKNAIEGSRNIPFMPAPKLLTEVRADLDKLNQWVRNFYVKLEMDNTFKQEHVFAAFNTETISPAYTLFNAGIGADVFNKNEQAILNINLSLINMGDIAYQHHLSRLKYGPVNLATGRTGVYNMGRNFSIKINMPLSILLKK